ncbi:MAG: PAS domain S-box protein, partial [Acidobacteriota bacterium]
GKRKDGSLVDFEASVSTSSVGGCNYITTMVRNIAERKQVQKALRESEERFRAAFEQANVGIVQASFDGFLQTVNPGFCKIVGYSEGEAKGLPIRDITHPEDYAKEEELTRLLMAGEIGGYTLEKRFLRKDGSIIWGQMTAAFVRQESGEPFYMLAIIEDITDRKRTEGELKKINEELEGRIADRTVELMVMNANLQAEISERRRQERERASIMRRLLIAQEDERRRIARDMHDHFGQQLTTLLLKLGMLREDYGNVERLSEQVETLEGVARQLDSDVDFLVWELRPTALDDLGLQDALINYTQDWSQHFSIPIEVHTHGIAKENLNWEIETVLYRIVQEALNNIAKHAQAKGVSVLLEHRAETLSLIIEDDGLGFDPETAFETKGKRLGLVGMVERAALVNGTAEFESQPGLGTTVYVRIPVSAGSQKGAMDG